MLDTTLVAVLSEFTRTPKLNSEEGKDHWPVASALLFGAGIEGGGRTIGGTDERLDPLPVDLATGEVDDKGTVPDYGNFAAGLMELLDIDPEAYLPGVEAYRALGV